MKRLGAHKRRGKNVSETALLMETRCLLVLKHSARLQSDARRCELEPAWSLLAGGRDRLAEIELPNISPLLCVIIEEQTHSMVNQLRLKPRRTESITLYVFSCRMNSSHLELLFPDFLLRCLYFQPIKETNRKETTSAISHRALFPAGSVHQREGSKMEQPSSR